MSLFRFWRHVAGDILCDPVIIDNDKRKGSRRFVHIRYRKTKHGNGGFFSAYLQA